MASWRGPLCRALRRRVGEAVARWSMIAPGDRILVGLSGGKDSLVLLHALSDIRRRSPVKFELAACTVALTGMDTPALRDYCAARDVSYTVLEQPIMEIIEERGERSPCSFCANMRRGRLCAWAAEQGFNRLALGHSMDDAVETFFMNLLRAGRARSFLPVVLMFRTGVTVIRPLVLSTEAAIIDEAKRLALPILETACPYAGHTERQNVRERIDRLRGEFPDLYSKVLNALKNLSGADAWSGGSGEK
ncbi:MAG: tRNA 2-thiocytidine biosynthesis TtcA family protein [Fretibacterium sp.]|nr:tRNA 2-thiocytidine biosynthesis TtcA family protein [Fretibacterium sp.]